MTFFPDLLRSPLPVLPTLVFFAELTVVTLFTMRVLFLSRGRKLLASVVGFFEVSIWLFAIGQIMQNLSDVGCYVGFAGGFTLGNFLGILLEKKLAIGMIGVQVVTNRDAGDLLCGLRTAGYGVTSLDGHGASGPVKVVYTVLPRKELNRVLDLVQGYQPGAFYSVQELQAAEAGIFPERRARGLQFLTRLAPPLRGIAWGLWQPTACAKEEAVVAEQG